SAPVVHADAPGNVIVEGRVRTANFAAATAIAHRRVTVEIRSRRQNAAPLEPRAAHATYDAASGRVTLTCTTQTPHLTRTAIADVVGRAEGDLGVMARDGGGGLGQKMSLGPDFVVVPWLARGLRTPVAWSEDRRENLTSSYHARDLAITLEGFFDTDA